MKFCDFKLFDFSLQALIIYREGVYLGSRGVDDFFVALYQVHNFYVELYYRFHNREIVKCISFHSEVLLEPYLKQIQLNELFSQLLVEVETKSH